MSAGFYPRFVRAAAVLCLLSPAVAAGQQPSADAFARKRATAMKLTGAVRVDGRLDEEAWLLAPAITDFIQKEPIEGAAPSDAMDVRFVYDEAALYVGARMAATNKREIQSPLGRRDAADDAEHILVALDAYLDRRTSVTFGVTASGVRIDRFYPTDSEEGFDAGFDPVWEAKTFQDENGWTAELWIPFSQLRFSAESEQVWGLNVKRFRPTLDEEDYWVLVPRTERAWASRFGDLGGISTQGAPRQIEFLPYVAGASTHNANRDARNPFDDGKNLAGRVGADIKLGLGPNLTLNATVNPDFGQVEADPAEVNLTTFETRFSEKRPFFVEGSQIFSLYHQNFYYSRRIGARPIGPASGDYVDYPDATTILAAAKLTGRLPSKTSIGFISAVTGEESAGVSALSGLAVPSQTTIPVTPRAYWNVGRVLQEFGDQGSTFGFLMNTVHRDLSDTDPLADLLTKNALLLEADTTLRFRNGEYQLQMGGGPSFLDGTPKAVERFQRASSHYAQRPDRDYAVLDPTRTSLTGYSFKSIFERLSGRHWLWSIGTKVDSPTYETNDVATLNNSDGLQPNASMTWRETRPGRVFRSYSLGLSQNWEWSFGGARRTAMFRPSVNMTWKNFWTSSLSYSYSLRGTDAYLTRGGPLMGRPKSWSTQASVGNRTTSQTRWSGRVTVGGNEDGGTTRQVNTSFSFRPGPRWQLSAGPFYERLTEPQQYVSTVTGSGRAETYNNRYVFAYIDRATVSMDLRMGFTIRPDMNLDVYAEPFAASGRYYDFGELLLGGQRERLTYGEASGTTFATRADGTRVATVGDKSFALGVKDFNTLSFRSNIVLRWEWRPGSTLYLVWQQDRSSSETLGTRVDAADMFRSFSAPGSNFFIVKTSFWLPVK